MRKRIQSKTVNVFFATMLIKFGLIAFGLIASGCQDKNSSSGGGGSSLSAEIIGLEDGDESLEGIAYKLICNKNFKKPILGEKKLGKVVTFPEREINLGDTCALEITATQTQSPLGPYTWLARKDNQPVPQLFYSSNLAPVQLSATADGKRTKYLGLKVIKTYGIEYKDPFFAKIPVNFEKEIGAVVPQSAGLLASIECSSSKVQAKTFLESSSAAEPGSQPDQRLFTFKLSVHKMQNTRCEKITVAINNVVLYEGKMASVTFSNPKVNDDPSKDRKLLFDPVSVRPSQESFGLVKCAARNNAKKCTTIERGQGAEVWVAVVNMTISGNEQNVIVTGSNGLAPDPGNRSRSTSDVQQHIDGRLPPKTFQYYQYAGAKPKILGANDDPKQRLIFPYTAATQTSIAADLIDTANVLRGKTRVNYIVAAYAHGFKTVSEGYLNSFSGARWFAHTIIHSGPNKVGEVLIGGGRKYFQTDDNLRPASSAGAFLTQSEYQKNNAPSDSRYRTYTFQGNGVFATNCNKNLDFFRVALGQKNQEQLTQVDAAADACELTQPAQLQSLLANNLLFTPRYYLWGWHSFPFE